MSDVIVSFYLSTGIYERILRPFGGNSRLLGQRVKYFLEVMMAVAQTEPSFRRSIKFGDTTPRLKNYSKIYLPEDQYDFLLHWSAEYGIKVSPFINTLLWHALELHDMLVAADQLVTKGELINAISRHHTPLKQRVN
jgi:hypothetical protein